MIGRGRGVSGAKGGALGVGAHLHPDRWVAKGGGGQGMGEGGKMKPCGIGGLSWQQRGVTAVHAQ